MKKYNFIFIFIIFIFVAANKLRAQGTLIGIIEDSLSHKPLVAANIFIPGTALGGATNIDGEYRIDGIPEGTYDVEVNYIGYQSIKTSTTIQAKKFTILDVSLLPQIIQGEVIEITAQAEAFIRGT